MKINEALVTLYSLDGQSECQNVMPVCYSFFKKEFSKYAEKAQTYSEVASVLKELCDSLERADFKEHIDGATKRLSIVDPKGFKTSGPRTLSTSTKVDHCAHVQRSKMVERFQVDVLDRKPKQPKTKRHKCSICLQDGHHPQTCRSILDPEHKERADLFLKQLVVKGKVQRYMDSLAKRATREFVQGVIRRVEQLSVCSHAEDCSDERGRVD